MESGFKRIRFRRGTLKSIKVGARDWFSMFAAPRVKIIAYRGNDALSKVTLPLGGSGAARGGLLKRIWVLPVYAGPTKKPYKKDLHGLVF